MKIILVVLVLCAVGCTSYPRYTTERPNIPKEQIPSRGNYKTKDFIRLGLIMREYLGKPYKGKSRYDEGIDCSMFTSSVYNKFNKTKLPSISAEQYKIGKDIPRSRLSFGDLVFFRTERNKISHVGIYIGDNEFIHASTSSGVIITKMSENYWAQRYAGARRILQ